MKRKGVGSVKLFSRETLNHSIAGRNFKGVVLLSLFLILGTCCVSGRILFIRNFEVYTDYVYSTAYLFADTISGIAPTKYLETQTKDEEYYNIRYTFMSAGISSAEIKDIYLVIPTEEDLIYISEIYHNLPEDETAITDKQADFLQHKPYQKGEKEAMQEALRDSNREENHLYLCLRKLNGEQLATALVPLYSMENEVPALVGVDISISTLTKSLLQLCLLLSITIATITSIGLAIHYERLKSQVIRPVQSLKRGADEMLSRLDSDEVYNADVHTGDELEDLAHSMEEMDRSLKHYIRENTAITAEREHMRTELELAKRIQEDMLPCTFPPYPDRREFDIYASMDPAKEIGGDFYDFFLIDEDHLGLVIADVSGKGIPAALFMMMVKIIVHNCALAGLSPVQTMQQVNKQLTEQTSESMFVTIWFGVLDCRSGVITAVNAGHEYPIVKKPQGGFAVLKDKHGIAVGVMDVVRYHDYELQLEPGSTLFVYSDGLPEATSSEEELFGLERIVAVLNEKPDADPKEILENMNRAVDAFVGEAPQFDDLTMMCIAYHGPDGGKEKGE